MSTNWTIEEPQNPDKYLADNLDKIKVGDTIELFPNNQENYFKYEVIEKDGEKTLNEIDSYDKQLARAEDAEFGSEKSEKGGKKHKKTVKGGKKKSKPKRRTNKKSQNKKRKSARRK
jgi:hypothetical protein